VSFLFDEAGDVKDVLMHVNYGLVDDSTWLEEARVRRAVSVWAGLSQAQKDAADGVAKTLNSLAQSI
jgi:hypothetical protein